MRHLEGVDGVLRVHPRRRRLRHGPPGSGHGPVLGRWRHAPRGLARLLPGLALGRRGGVRRAELALQLLRGRRPRLGRLAAGGGLLGRGLLLLLPASARLLLLGRLLPLGWLARGAAGRRGSLLVVLHRGRGGGGVASRGVGPGCGVGN